jgi:hypothetical protein
VGSRIAAIAFLQFAAPLLQSSARLVKGKRALLESNPPAITNWRLISTMSEGVAEGSRPFTLEIILMSFPMAQKTHARASAIFDFTRLRSNSAGGT